MAASGKSSAHKPLGNIQLVILQSEDAEAIEELVQDAVEAQEVAGETEKSWRRYQDALLRDLLRMLKSSDHTWHFLNALGLHLHSKPLDCKAHARGLLLLHCLLCRGTSSTVARAARKLLDPASSQDRPALDLHKLAKHLHQHQQSVDGNPPRGHSSSFADGVQFIVAYCHYLLNRIYCSAAVSNRLFAQPGSSADQTAASAGKEGGSSSEAEIGLGESFWSQQAAEAVLSKLEALQKLQDLLLRCGQAAPSKSSEAFRGCSQGTAASQEGDRLAGRVLELLLEDSFCVYGSINYGLIELMNRFGAMDREQAMSALHCFRLSGQQGQSLSELYTALGQRGVGAGLPFPSVVVLAPKSISNLEKMTNGGPSSPDGVTAVQLFPPTQPSHATPQPPASATPPPASASSQLVAYDPHSTPQDQAYDLTRALFGSSSQPQQQQHPPGSHGGSSAPGSYGSSTSGTGSQPASRQGWEVALDMTAGGAGATQQQQQQQQQQHHHQHTQQHQGTPASPSPFSSSALAVYAPPPVTPSLPGGWDQLLLDSLYETAEAQRKVHQAAASRMSRSGGGTIQANGSLLGRDGGDGAYGVAVNSWGNGGGMVSVGVAGGADPFAASTNVPPPPYVQMALRAQQQLAMELERRLLSQRAQYMLAVKRGQISVPGGMSGVHMSGGVGMVAAGTGIGGEMGACYSWTGGGVRYGGVVVPF